MARRDTAGGYRGSTVTASDPPTIEEGIPSRCLSFTLRGDWGHFRRIDRTVTKQTYRLPPRTTLAGLLAAVVGVGRDGYYDVFDPDSSAVAVELLASPRTVSLPQLGLGTDPSKSFETYGGTGNRTVQARVPDSTRDRQLHAYHYLVDPAYRVSVAVEDPTFYGTLRDRLESGTTHYTPTLGLSELHATLGYGDEPGTGELEVTPSEATGTVAVEGAVPDGIDAIRPEPGTTYEVERVPGSMRADETGRRTTGYVDYAFRTDGGPLTVDPGALPVARVGDRNLVFA